MFCRRTDPSSTQVSKDIVKAGMDFGESFSLSPVFHAKIEMMLFLTCTAIDRPSCGVHVAKGHQLI